MRPHAQHVLHVLGLLAAPALSGCSSCMSRGPVDTDAKVVPVDLGAFQPSGLASPPTSEPCTLGGTASTCHVLTITGRPSTHAVGPFCPRTIDTPGDQAGAWPANGQLHDLSGSFVRDLATFYDDSSWQLYDPANGRVRVTDTKEACDLAARPDVDPKYQNHCVECDLAEVEGPTTLTFRIPSTPVKRTQPVEIGHGRVGVSLEGVVFDAPAPVRDILAAHTIAAFDDCGGHVNPHVGYHYHAATGCSKQVEQADGHAPLIGYALDGFGMFAQESAAGEEPADLDPCRGHEDATRGYHYHVAGPGENLFIGCFMGDVGSVR